jgi:hypothetical protein
MQNIGVCPILLQRNCNMFDLISVGQVQQPQQQQPGMLMTVGGGGQVPMQMAGQQRMMIRNIGQQQQQQGGNLRQVLTISQFKERSTEN